MNKTITVYELLGMVKDGKAPKKIKYYYREYVYDEYKGEIGYVDKNIYPYKWFAKEIDCDLAKDLNDTIEIIEDNDKLEKMQDFDLTLKETNVTKDLELTYEGVSKTFNYAWHKIDEIIDHINKIEEKLDER